MASLPSSSVQASPSGSATASTASTQSSIMSPIEAPEGEKHVDDTNKLRMFLGILRKFIGVADIASVRFSLPAQLLEPTPNLEYWNYLDRPEMFIAIGDSDDELDRMLEVLRFWFTKDLKYVKGKPCKPYNSALGEFFRCNWEVTEAAQPVSSIRKNATPSSAASSIKSVQSEPEPNNSSATALPVPAKPETPVLVSYLTEQTSHHPPVSAFYVDCPEKGISARGFDQISAKFTGTSIKVTPGEHNLGIFITLHKRDDEQYQLTHPAAHLGGLLRGSLSVTVGDNCYIRCPKTKMKTILSYKEEGWLGKTQNKVEGVIFRYDPENDDKTRLKDVPDKDVLALITGNWREKTYFTLGPKSSDPPTLLLDVTPLSVHPKILPPDAQQLSNESLRFWSGVTDAIKGRQFGRATQLKQEIEERQRDKARKRQDDGVTWSPRFFTGSVTPLGKPELTLEGRAVLNLAHEGRWELAESEVLGA